MKNALTNSTEVQVRFNEVDSLGIVWHGHYVRYFEDGREGFGLMHGISYLDVHKQGFVTPLVSVHCDFKRSLKYGDWITVQTSYIPCEAAKMKFNYELFNKGNGELIATGNTVQVFLDKDDFILQLANPPFFEAWKRKNGLT